jgi:hypothetical protein
MMWRPAVGCVFCALLAACGRPGGDEPDQFPRSAQLDSGNISFAHGDHAAALAHYRAAAVTDEQNAAAWFGVYMASMALGDTAAAAAALSTVQQLVPDAAWREHPHDGRAPPPAGGGY